MIIYIIGSGVMGSAIAKALAKKGHKVIVHDKTFLKARRLGKYKNILPSKNFKHLSKAQFIVLAVKPHNLAEVALAIQKDIAYSAIIISIAVGIKIAKIQELFAHQKVLRIMPNLGLAVGQGIAAMVSAGLSKVDRLRIKRIIDAFSENFELKKESEIDSVAAISGSGPAYFFYFAQGLVQAACNLGFSKELARKLVEKTLNAVSILQKNQNYADLISQVASKKGTTLAALRIFKQSNLNKIMLKAAKAAVNRAREINNE